MAENIDQRRPDMAAEDTFPGWWRKYFFFGTNGGGDYYGMRLDGTPGVWFLACDGAKIKLYAKSLDEFVAKSLENYDKELELYMRLEELYQKKVRGEVTEEDFKRKWQEILNSE